MSRDESLFAAVRAAMPDASHPFLRLPGGTTITYGDMLARSSRLAHAIAASGVRPGDRVAVQVEKSANALLLYLACLRAGAIYLPLNPAYTVAEIEYFLADAEPRLVAVSPARESAVRALAGERASLHTLGDDGKQGSILAEADRHATTFADVPGAANAPAAILYTSGTTGRSKGAMLSQENLLSNACVLRDLWRFTPNDVLLHALPIFHTHGLFTATNTLLMAGGSMMFLPRFEPDAIFAALPHTTAMMGVPTFYTRLLADSRLDCRTTAHIRLFISGSAPLLAETHRQWFARTGHIILERYGMTETGMIASNPYAGERVAGSVGFALPGVALRVAAPDSGAELPQGDVGTIELRGPNVFAGYWRNPEQTAQAFRPDGFFITGDLGRIDERGYLHIVGRAKDVIISGGFNVYPKEIEAEIDSLPGVRESAVIGVPHADLGEAVTAVVVLDPGAKLDEAVAIRQLGERLARYKLPKRIFVVEELPRNTMGKVQKALLRQAHRQVF
ncbi:MAG TPA: malonyl-CoA synthase [Rhizomicrobium sp.]|jgi:malonyl-CoA/methylmalonyl-CoA synthetase|nr:malonyl-CoA synthase [Rhizomicrobium sp.]